MNTANVAYIGLLDQLTNIRRYKNYRTVAPRGQDTVEIMGYRSQVEMRHPIVTLPDRGLNYSFMAAEALWILSGRSDVEFLTKHCKNMAKYSDDGYVLSGAYGPPFVAQLDYVVRKLIEDQSSRQAVMTIWRQNPGPSKDIPCTVAVQFLIRQSGTIFTNVFMRASDAWLGWPYDIFTFTMMTCMVGARINQVLTAKHGVKKLGLLSLFAGSQHLYIRDIDKADNLITGNLSDNGDDLTLDNIFKFHPDHIKECLRSVMECPSNEPRVKFRSIIEG